MPYLHEDRVQQFIYSLCFHHSRTAIYDSGEKVSFAEEYEQFLKHYQDALKKKVNKVFGWWFFHGTTKVKK